jgi:hypothetical protein
MPPEETTAPTSPSPAPSSAEPIGTNSPASPAQEGGSPTASPVDVFSGFDFANMDFADEIGDTTPVDNTAKSGQETKAPVEPAKPVGTPAPVQPAPAQAQAQPATPATPAPQTPAPATPAPASPATVGETDPYLKAWNENQKALDSELQKYYAIDDATAEKILENPKETLPAIFAKLHMAVLQNAYKSVLDRLPPLMQATAQSVKESSAAEDRFFNAWKVFNPADPTQRQVLTQYGQMFRQANPGASEADFTKFVGAAAAAHLGLKMPARQSNGKGKPIPYSPSAASAPASGSGDPKPTQFEDMFSATIGNQE